MCNITDQNNGIILQSMSIDFNTNLINHSHMFIAQLNQSFDNISKSKIEHLIISRANGLNIVMINLKFLRYNLKELICSSENLSSNKLILLAGVLKNEISK